MSSTQRLGLFAAFAAALFLIAFGVLRFLPGAPVPSPLCDVSNLIQDQRQHAAAFRGWLTQSHITILVGLFSLAFAWLYLQILHGSPRLWTAVINSFLALIAAAAAGWWVRSTASTWALSQTGTCLDDTLRSQNAWDVSFAGSASALRFSEWGWAVFFDAFGLAIVAVLLGSLAYFITRRVASI